MSESRPIQSHLVSKLIKRFLYNGITSNGIEEFFQHKHFPGWEETMMFCVNNIFRDSDLQVLIVKEQKNDRESQNMREVGNKAMKSHCYEEALLCYTKSIALARSEGTLALAYANRGRLLKCMGLMKDSIEDTERALALQYPKDLQYKLYVRLCQCYQQLGDKEAALNNFSLAMVAMATSKLSDSDKEELERTMKMDMLILEQGVKTLTLEDSPDWKLSLTGIPRVSPAPPPHLTNGSNPTFPNISKNVRVCYNKTFGRHLVAAEDMKPGDVVIVEEAICAVLLETTRYNHCSFCAQRCLNLIPCPKCAWCMFCSEECLTNAAQKHELECSVFPIISDNFDMPMCIITRLISNMGLEALSEFAENNEQELPQTPQEWLNLGVGKDGKFSGLNAGLSFKFNITDSYAVIMNKCIFITCISKLLNFNSLKSKIKVEALLLKILISFRHTAWPMIEFQIRETETQAIEIGKLLVSSPSLLNHSCSPNVVQHYHKTTTVVRALQVIPRDTQLFVSYGRTYVKFPKSVRQSVINPVLGFQCNCEACENNWPEFNSLTLCPSFELPRDQKANARIVASMKQLIKKGMIHKKFALNKETLPMYLKHLILLDKFNQKHNQAYHQMLEEVRIYFAKQGNIHVKK